jgi:hypothetical protein
MKSCEAAEKVQSAYEASRNKLSGSSIVEAKISESSYQVSYENEVVCNLYTDKLQVINNHVLSVCVVFDNVEDAEFIENDLIALFTIHIVNGSFQECFISFQPLQYCMISIVFDTSDEKVMIYCVHCVISVNDFELSTVGFVISASKIGKPYNVYIALLVVRRFVFDPGK